MRYLKFCRGEESKVGLTVDLLVFDLAHCSNCFLHWPYVPLGNLRVSGQP